MTQVMISYRQVDGQREFAYELEQTLAQAGLKTWIDKNDIPPLSRWEDAIFEGIRTSDFVVLCLSPQYFESEICLMECYIARGYGKRLLPVIVPHNTPDMTGSSILNMCQEHEETTGIEHLNLLDFNWGKIMGLPESKETMIGRLIQSMQSPQPVSMEYDAVMSFKWHQSPFATRVADDLTAAGIKTFIHTRGLDVGVEWRRVAWNASLSAQFHLVVLSPDIAESAFISKEVLMSRAKKTTFVPVLPPEFAADNAARSQIREALSSNRNLVGLNEVQWLIPEDGYESFIEKLQTAVNASLK